MAAPGGGVPIGPNGMPLTQEQIQMIIAMEAQKRGMTVPQFQQWQQQQIAQEAAKVGMSPQDFVKMKQQEQMQQRKQIEDEAKAAGMTPQQYVQMRQQQEMQRQQAMQQQGGQPPQPGQPQPQPPGGQQRMQQINLAQGVEPKPDALAVAKFLRSQNLKTRTCIFNGQRKDMFKVKRAFRALNSDAYKKARTKNPLLPEVKDEQTARNTLQLLPLSMLALRVSKADPHEGHNHAKPKKEKRVKGLWTVKIEQQQDFDPMMHYVWIYEAPQYMLKVYAGLAVLAVFTVILFPLWPMFMRIGVSYLSYGALGLLGLFFAMAIFRLILFLVTLLVAPPGLWLFPNLFEDVSFFESFVPLWGWQETKKGKKSKKVDAGPMEKGSANGTAAEGTTNDVASTQNGAAVTSSAEAATPSAVMRRPIAPTVEDADDD